MANHVIIPNLSAYESYRLTLAGATAFAQRIARKDAGSQGAFSVAGVGSGLLAFSKDVSYATKDLLVPGVARRHASLIAPAPGETVLVGQELRFVASGYDNSFSGGAGLSACATKVEFYANETLLTTVLNSDNAEFNVFKGRALHGLAAGAYSVWCRAWYTDGSYNDSRAHPLTVAAVPTYGATVTLIGPTAYTAIAATLATGIAGSRVLVNGNGYAITGTGATAVNWQYVDFVNLGATSGNVSTRGTDITTTGGTTIVGCRWFQCTPGRITTNTGTVTVQNSLWSSNSRVPVGQYPSEGADDAHNSWPSWEFDGASTSAKVFEGNNCGAGWWSYFGTNWTIGGTTAAKENIAIGPRVGYHLETSFAGTLSLDFAYHTYYGGWSQGNIVENLSGAATIIEHSIFMQSSWPMRGMDGTVRYCLFLATDTTAGVEGLIWTMHSTTLGGGTAHHCILRAPTPSRGLIFQDYVGASTIRNLTIDGVNQGGTPGEASAVALHFGTMILKSCAILRAYTTAVGLDAGTTLTADYNAFNGGAGANYSDGRTPAHDISAAPGFSASGISSGPVGDWIPFDLAAVWTRTKSVKSILSDYRGYYTPTSSAYDAGDTAGFGTGTPIGAINRAGTSNASDLFGTL